MKCPYCGYGESKVTDSRPVPEQNAIKRRRECLGCEKRFSTFEKIETAPLVVVKKSGERERFSRDKLLMGIMRACEKRPVSVGVMDSIVDEIEACLSNSLAGEVSTEKIGGLVMERLKNTDEVAYVRFASVYRRFKDINTFLEEVQKLLKKQPI
jgi:transcriptional repressor NrdR